MFIAHRINYLDAEKAKEIFSEADGIEFDVRDGGVGHDPWATVQPIEDFLRHCPPNKFYIVNIKCEGIEERTIELMETHGLRNFFLLDCGVPSMIRLSKKGERRLAVRYSEYESLSTVLLLADKVQWVWTDVFSRMPLTKEIAEKIHTAGLRICLVSPELQGQPDKILHYRDYLVKEGITIDAVCSKIWNQPTWLLHDALFPCPN
jgi:hypothetical protein